VESSCQLGNVIVIVIYFEFQFIQYYCLQIKDIEHVNNIRYLYTKSTSQHLYYSTYNIGTEPN
jgi:hypothetical protein